MPQALRVSAHRGLTAHSRRARVLTLGAAATIGLACGSAEHFDTPNRIGCGNGKVEAEEECDDGNRRDGDTCSSDCRRWSEVDVRGETNGCPEFAFYSLTPYRAMVGGSMWVDVVVTDPDDDQLQFSWEITAGQMQSLVSPVTRYTCLVSGKQTLTLTAVDPSGCSNTLRLEGECVDKP